LELFRSTISLYEDGVKSDSNADDDDEFSCLTNSQLKRQKLDQLLSQQAAALLNGSTPRAAALVNSSSAALLRGTVSSGLLENN